MTQPSVEGVPIWIWRAVEDKEGAAPGPLRDPSALPENKAEHLRRIRERLWGPRWVQLRPAKVVRRDGQKVVVREREPCNDQFTIPVNQVLQWYEGLLVLDCIQRATIEGDLEVGWFTKELQDILQEESAKHKNHMLTASAFLTGKLMHMAATGPEYVTCEGKVCSHRRKLDPHAKPGEGDPKDGWYKVQGLAEYLPPWEAFLHPKCGIYQDYYIVQWGPPYNVVKYGDHDNGVERLVGATWEPDECLPDDLDALRVERKRIWTESQKKREAEQLLKSEAKQEQKAREEKRKQQEQKRQKEQEDEALREALRIKRARSLEDITGKAGHYFEWTLSKLGEEEIKKGWPKSDSDFPPGHGAASPPGCCGPLCDCMEDWHVGTAAAMKRAWTEDAARGAAAQAVVDGLATAGDGKFLTRRGIVSGRSYLEAWYKPDLVTAQAKEMKAAAEFAQAALAMVRDAAQSIPLAALRDNVEGSDPENLLRHLAVAFGSEETVVIPDVQDVLLSVGPYAPLLYRLEDGPSWFQVQSSSGAVTIKEQALPPLDKAKLFDVRLILTSLDGKPSEMKVKIDLTRPLNYGRGGPLERNTARLVATGKTLRPEKLRTVLEERLSPIYDFAASDTLTVPVTIWVPAVIEAALAARACSVSHLVASPEVPGLAPRTPPRWTK